MDNRQIKNYYRHIENYDWTYAADKFIGPETILHHWRAKVSRELIGRFGKGNYLDVGCGTGLILRYLPADSTGVDLNPRNLVKARRYAPSARLIQADIEEHLPFGDQSFLTVICTEVLEHLWYPEKTLAEIKRLLSPGGCLIGSVPSKSLIWRLRALSGSKKHFQGEPYHRHRTRKEVAELLCPFFQEVTIFPKCLGMNWFFRARN